MSASDPEDRLQLLEGEYRELLEGEYRALEWMVVYLASRNLMKEPDPVAAAEAMKQDVKNISQAAIQAALERCRHGGVNDRLVDRATGLASATTALASQIVEEIYAIS